MDILKILKYLYIVNKSIARAINTQSPTHLKTILPVLVKYLSWKKIYISFLR